MLRLPPRPTRTATRLPYPTRCRAGPWAAERALPHIRPGDSEHLAALHARLIAAEHDRDYPTALEANFDFHFGLYWRSSMPTLIELLESLWIRVGPLLNDLYPDGHPPYEDRHQNEVVLAALRKPGRTAGGEGGVRTMRYQW